MVQTWTRSKGQHPRNLITHIIDESFQYRVGLFEGNDNEDDDRMAQPGTPSGFDASSPHSPVPQVGCVMASRSISSRVH